MKEGIKRIFSLGLILLLLVKGLSSLLPVVSSMLDNIVLTEIQAESEQENQKKSNSKMIETELIEDVFEKPHFCYAELSDYPVSSKCIMDSTYSLQMVHLDIATPPPDVSHS